ncbi:MULTISPECIES: acetate/propionate family kinase [Variovorax]|uniref:acetate/propionate family kinase n=1 Tax=Variovorax TaxID=34072 RepID=UPI00285DE17B|nr:acetate/propionate family kinase [Variovorax sp. 3319]MDR6890794.1 acetate kinase [Variovorax sp. 3319]
MTGNVLLTFNPGSSSIKLGLFAIDAGAARAIARCTFDASPDALSGVMAKALDWVNDAAPRARLVAAGHRVVHGGDAFEGPVAITEGTLAAIEALASLAPLHQPQSLRLIHALRRVAPALPQSASFDTAFHCSQSAASRRYALPRALFDQGIRRYGFHGLSYQCIASQLRQQHPGIAAGRVVVAHLGSGASLCGLLHGASRETSMGFSTLDGIPMATRSGALDPGVLIHLLRQPGQSIDTVEDMLYHRSGLLGLSGVSGDVRELLASDAPEAHEALVFTAGVGENQPAVRDAVCRHLAWLGVPPGPEDARIAVLVMHTDEEQVIADEACQVLSLHPTPGACP